MEENLLDKYTIENISIDFSKLDYEDINGLLGLDILMEGNFIIDLDQMKLRPR